MKILRCPQCGVWPATDVSNPTGVDAAGFTTVTRIVRCPGCGNTLTGDPRTAQFLNALAEWKANYEDLKEPDSEPESDTTDSDATESDATQSDATQLNVTDLDATESGTTGAAPKP